MDESMAQQDPMLARAVMALLLADTSYALAQWGRAQQDTGATWLPASPAEWSASVPQRQAQPQQSASVQPEIRPVQPAVTLVQPVASVQPRPASTDRGESRGESAVLSALSSVRANISSLTSVQSVSPASAKKQIDANVENCRMCTLGQTRQGVLNGYGPIDAKIVFVGAGGNPNEFEEKRLMAVKGKPEAAELFDKMIAAMKSILPDDAKESMYFTNVIKCSAIPPRPIQRKIANTCLVHLREEIRMIKPKIIVIWGQTAYSSMFGDDTSIISVRGQVRRFEQIPAIVTHHPLECLKNQNLKKLVWNDLRTAVHVLKGEPTL